MGNNKDSLGDRMKGYELTSRAFLTRRIPVIIRIDGKAFHTFTKGLHKPFDPTLMKIMQETMRYLCANVQGCVFGYTQSDEITLVLTDYTTIKTDAWFGYNVQKNWCFLPVEYEVEEGNEVFLVDDNGAKVGEGVIEKVLKKDNKTNVARVKATEVDNLNNVNGFIVKERYPQPLNLRPLSHPDEGKAFVCHCEDVDIKTLLDVISKGFPIVDTGHVEDAAKTVLNKFESVSNHVVVFVCPVFLVNTCKTEVKRSISSCLG
jgi:hypothetical protein